MKEVVVGVAGGGGLLVKEQGRAKKERVCNNFFYERRPPPPPPPFDFGCQAFQMSGDEWLIPSGCKNGVGRQHTTIEFFFLC